MTSIFYLVGVFFIQVLDLVTFFLPKVTQLPFGIDASFVSFVGLIKGFESAVPLAVHPLVIFGLILSISSALFIWGWIRWFIELLRGA